MILLLQRLFEACLYAIDMLYKELQHDVYLGHLSSSTSADHETILEDPINYPAACQERPEYKDFVTTKNVDLLVKSLQVQINLRTLQQIESSEESPMNELDHIIEGLRNDNNIPLQQSKVACEFTEAQVFLDARYAALALEKMKLLAEQDMLTVTLAHSLRLRPQIPSCWDPEAHDYVGKDVEQIARRLSSLYRDDGPEMGARESRLSRKKSRLKTCAL